ncbi:MAG TPA: FAD-dependent oxidoreductase [Intrasporangiaceae bacterium]|nr:FAD-dependent oxidoreductase [Intrasporangiaceae bacterium]
MTLRPLWWDSAAPGPRHDGEVPQSVDVVIVGGGFTGLWSAYYLLEHRPDLNVLVLEAEHVGFGASGRNGGWVSALWPVSPETIAARHGREATLDFLAALRETVDEVGDRCAAEGIDAGFVKGGTLSLARSPAQEQRARAEVAHADRWGLGTLWLDRDATRDRLAATAVRGSAYNPNCGRIHPRRLVDGLAAAVVRRGALIREGVRVGRISRGVVALEDGRLVSARHVLRATEAWTAQLPGHGRDIAPVYSLMVATEPLSAEQWADIGLDGREVWSDQGHVIIYGQRTVDDRIAFGGRGAPYHFGSTIRPEFDQDSRVFADLIRVLHQILPQLADVPITHTWGGPLGIARDWHPSVGYADGVGWAGGYVGDGVAATNLAGRTLADLVLGRDTPLVRMPWVNHRSPRWEPEPLRWLGVNAGLRLAHLADREERRTGAPARLGAVLDRLTGGS